MNATKERIIGAITVMTNSEADRLWDIISTQFTSSWDDIEEVEPDKWDLQMLADIENDPECKEFD